MTGREAAQESDQPRVAADTLWKELQRIQDARNQYRDLFEVPAHEVLLRESASWFAECYHQFLIDEIILRIARLAEKAECYGSINLSLEAVLKDPYLQDDAELKNKLREKIEGFRESAKPLIEQRHKYLAHLDYNIATGATPHLTGLTWSNVDSLIAVACEIYSTFRSGVYQSNVSYKLVAEGDPKSLIKKLEAAKNWEALKAEVLSEHYQVSDESPTNAAAKWKNLVERILAEENRSSNGEVDQLGG